MLTPTKPAKAKKEDADTIQEGHVLTSNSKQMEAENLRLPEENPVQSAVTLLYLYALNKPRTRQEAELRGVHECMEAKGTA